MFEYTCMEFKMIFLQAFIFVAFSSGLLAVDLDDTICGKIFNTSSTGVFMTPGYPKPVQTTNTTLKCTWKVVIPTISGCNNHVSFNLQMNGVSNTTKESTTLIITDNLKKKEIIPIVVKNGSNVIYSAKSTDITIVYSVAKAPENHTTNTGYGFKLSFYSNGTLPPKEIKDGNGVFSLDRQHAACNASWKIGKSPKNKGMILLRMYEDTVLPGSKISIDATPKGKNATQIVALTSTPKYKGALYIDTNITIQYNLVSPSFKTDGSGSDVVFLGSSIVIPSCDVGYTTQSGVVSSPMYPDMYPENAYCQSTIQVPKDYQVHLSYSTLQLAAGHNLTLKAGKKAIGTYTSKSQIPSDLITGGPVTVLFSSKQKSVITNMKTGQGFNMMYEMSGPSCGGYMNVDKPGDLTTPGYPKKVKAGTTCVWIIKLAPPKEKDQARYIGFTVMENSTMAGTTLEVKDGEMNSSKILNFNGTAGKESDTVYSRTNVILVRYTTTSDGFAFKLKYSINECDKSHQCGNGICIHPDWQCNGIDECGDMSDEKNCGGFATWVLAVAVVATFIGTVLIIMLVPLFVKKCRGRNHFGAERLTNEPDA